MHCHSAGDGHFSPVGGYHAESDMVLILDTARFKYPPHWVPLKGLYQAMAHVDSATSQPRGFLKIRANPRLESVMFTLNQPNRCAYFLACLAYSLVLIWIVCLVASAYSVSVCTQ